MENVYRVYIIIHNLTILTGNHVKFQLLILYKHMNH